MNGGGKVVRGLRTEDGFTFIETAPAVFTDGDATVTEYQLTADGIEYVVADDANHLLGEARVAEILKLEARVQLERTHDVIPDLGVCVDCTMYIANGDLPEDEAQSRAIVAGCEQEGYEWVLEDDTYDFSWSSCDCCGSTLGGARHGATLIRPKAK